MRHDPSDLGSLIRIRITPKERTLSLSFSIDPAQEQKKQKTKTKKQQQKNKQTNKQANKHTLFRARYDNSHFSRKRVRHR